MPRRRAILRRTATWPAARTPPTVTSRKAWSIPRSWCTRRPRTVTGCLQPRQRIALRWASLRVVYTRSMVPTLHPGDYLLVRYGAVVRPGDVAVLRHPLRPDLLIVKRLVQRRAGGWWVRGDNPLVDSDSRQFGTVPEEFVVARALARLRRASPRRCRRQTSSQRTNATMARRADLCGCVVGSVRRRDCQQGSGRRHKSVSLRGAGIVCAWLAMWCGDSHYHRPPPRRDRSTHQ
jgi:nickel-type superoxide dismutase maturation protease